MTDYCYCINFYLLSMDRFYSATPKLNMQHYLKIMHRHEKKLCKEVHNILRDPYAKQQQYEVDE